mmetsp:Transcript_12814/g.21696  ORF Transcript_12814/g.21696 Transcript_12814/m.21696 type:complete len:145 (-) Transcript_12814:95-529(-)
MCATRTSLLVALAVLLIAGAVSAGEFDHKSVSKYTDKDFKDNVSDGNVHFIKFFAPWCGHCKRLGPTWGQLGDAFSDHSVVKIASVDCTQHKTTCQNAGIRGYPTLKVFANGEEYKGHKGGRDLASLKSFIEDAAKDLTTETTE